ncbi:unnamed protein product [Paramecium octaurelia]|uniref:Uncharacterized protein n=1 Tax=Paramecium octaurelia TaxID=43137 RepID=A0A8S1V305_PAROT|nr:unnamed protein product [Paramecium octaurelia]
MIDFKCVNNHQLPILMVIFDQNLEFRQRFLFQDCIRSLSRQFSAMGYEVSSKQKHQTVKFN